MTIEVPELCLLVLVGPSGAGKTTFAASRFRPTEVISSDFCRGLVADDERDQSATPAAFQVLHLVTSLRLRRGRLTVVDAVNGRPADRRPLLDLAREHDCPAVAVVLDLPVEVAVERDRARPGRSVGPRVVHAQLEQVRRSLPGLGEEGFDAVHVLRSAAEVDAARFRRVPLPVNRRWEGGPFDVVGDVHGCRAELVDLLGRLGYRVEGDRAVHPDGRRVVFVGDLVGPGPDSAGVVRLVMGMAEAGTALAVRGDHDDRLASEPEALPAGTARFLQGLPSHLLLARGSLVVTHAGIRREMIGRDSPRVRRLCLTGEPGWAEAYRGRALCVHGHAPLPCARWLGRTLDLDTGCVTGGALTALRHPELELVSVPARPGC